MERIYSVEELVIDDTFINYCNNKNVIDSNIWENYLAKFPGESSTVEEAKQFVWGLGSMLKAKDKQQSIQYFIQLLQEKETNGITAEQKIDTSIGRQAGPGNSTNIYWWLAAASVAFVAIVALWLLVGADSNNKTLATTGNEKTGAGNNSAQVNSVKILTTGAREKKTFVLNDGTKLTLNANSRIEVDAEYGKTQRLVKLEGEAFFDVKHNASAPFLVRLKDFDVKVLGTMFNVKSYAGETTSEATLVKGKVEISIKNDPGRKLLLEPNQKVVLYNNETMANIESDSSYSKRQDLDVSIKPLSISVDGSSIVETGWMANRLEINDEKFVDLKNKLERKYGVKIIFSDDEVMQYRFTGLFKEEKIDQVLKALQLSYPFKYTVQNDQVTISK